MDMCKLPHDWYIPLELSAEANWKYFPLACFPQLLLIWAKIAFLACCIFLYIFHTETVRVYGFKFAYSTVNKFTSEIIICLKLMDCNKAIVELIVSFYLGECRPSEVTFVTIQRNFYFSPLNSSKYNRE